MGEIHPETDNKTVNRSDGLTLTQHTTINQSINQLFIAYSRPLGAKYKITVYNKNH